MASFGHFLGRKVTVQYRVGDVLLPASGTFAADSGRSIFLEQHLEQKGKTSYFRWEIPYQYIHKIEAVEDCVAAEAPASSENAAGQPESSQAAAAGAASGSGTSASVPLISMPHRPKIA
jgi:hypothetical protein